jgi:hypothetical protein
MSLQRFLQCRWLPEELFGQDVDDLFAYQTPRIAIVKARQLGLLKYFTMVCIFVYIIIFNIWYKGAHFSHTQVQGVSRLQWQEPTRGHCNPADSDCLSDFHPVKDLPYCRGYSGSDPVEVVDDCEYSEFCELPINIMTGVLMPTYIERYKQKRYCTPKAPHCDRKWKFVDERGNLQRQKGEAKAISSAFIADVGKYTVLIDHNFRTDVEGLGCDDFKMNGYWVDCKKDDREDCVTKEIKCLHSACDGQDSEFSEVLTKKVEEAKQAAQQTSLLDKARSSTCDG